MTEPNDKPVGARHGWHLLETSYPYVTPWIRLRQDRVRLDGNGEITYSYVEHPPAVWIVPVTTAGEIVLIRQYRYPIDAWCFEVPAGGSHDRGDMALDEIARAELWEEVGGRCEEMRYVAGFYNANAHSHMRGNIFLACGVTLDSAQSLERTEQIEIHLLPTREAITWARAGRIEDGESALALLLAEPLLQDLGYLDGAPDGTCGD